MSKPLPQRRYTASLENYWQEMFNELSAEQEEHSMSGWSSQGLKLRMQAYLQILSSLDLSAGAKVLDLGCGAGSYSRVLAEAGFQVTAVDFAQMMAQQARKRIKVGNAGFVSADACNLPFADEVFHHVLCVGLFQSLNKHSEALREICRVLKPNAPLCLMTLNRRNLKVQMDKVLGLEQIVVVNGEPQVRLRTYDPAGLIRDMQVSGFREVSSYPVQIYPDNFFDLRSCMGIWNRIPGVRYLTARSFMLVGRKPS